MNKEQVHSAVVEIEQSIRRDIHPDHAFPERNQEAQDYLGRSRHLLWMCSQIDEFMSTGRVEKAMRWLGFLQGAIWAMNLETISNLKKMNAPDDVTFDKERV